MVNQTATSKRPRFKFIRETIAELRKVVWLTRREALYLTGLVILVAVSVGAILGGIDYLFSIIVDKLIIGS